MFQISRAPETVMPTKYSARNRPNVVFVSKRLMWSISFFP
ncbi:Uncharacterised protein [Mycobacteroides abscessus subsp. abscessus]|nr:Uncharacterised protein [Mycobacteroides abscessus subsp. abscessus]